MRQLIQAIQPRHLGLAALVALAWIWLQLFRQDAYGIDEGAALALLLNWSIIHQLATPVALFGLPDLRAILFIPLDLHWAGSLPAAKVYLMLLFFGAMLALYREAERLHGDEPAMIAIALLLISPIAFMQVDALGDGAFLLTAMACIPWLERQWLNSPHTLPSWLFLLMLLTAFAMSVHPMGLAVPAALLWRAWRLKETEPVKARNALAAIGAATAFMGLLLALYGWHGLEPAVDNPLRVLGDAVLGPELLRSDQAWGAGFVLIDLLAIIVAARLFARRLDLLEGMLFIASAIGLLHADHAWALLAWAAILVSGAPLLIRLNERIGPRGLAGQRGLVLLAVLLVSVTEMLTARSYWQVDAKRMITGTDRVIAVLEREASNTNQPFVAASQWPARTLLVCRRDTLPLPPAMDDLKLFEKRIEGVTHFAFDPKDPTNRALARNLAALSHRMETLALLPDGAVVKVRSGGRE
ncbi:MAG: hypothetical protein R8K47_01035 [Mariprofundaceae bacterium]